MSNISRSAVVCMCVLLVFVALFTSCSPTQTSGKATPTKASVQKTPITPADQVKISDGMTEIVIDGDPGDWSEYPVSYEDPQGDHSGGGFDIIDVRAFSNDTFLYILIETSQPANDFSQLDLDIASGTEKYIISFSPQAGSNPFMGDVTSGEFKQIGEVTVGDYAIGDAVEIKIALDYFKYPDKVQVSNIRPMNGECCDEN